MSFSSPMIACVLFLYIFHASASVIPDRKIVESTDSGEFKVHIMERGTKFVEKIKIDEDNDIEYFHVPAHNGLMEADYLYDFKSNMTVTRRESDSKCYLGPLPENLPKPVELKTGLQMVSHTPASKPTTIVQKYWAVSEQVDKTLLRQEVQDFCGQFPVFRLEEVDFGNMDVGRPRSARNIELGKHRIPFCELDDLQTVDRDCEPDLWVLNFKIRRQRGCTYWLTCKVDFQGRTVCSKYEHLYSSMICYDARCP